MQYLFNFLSKEAASQLAELALADRANIAADKIFNGLVEGRVSKQLKEICLMDQVYVKAEDGKQSVSKYIAEVGKAAGSPFTIKKFVRFEVRHSFGLLPVLLVPELPQFFVSPLCCRASYFEPGSSCRWLPARLSGRTIPVLY